MKNRIRTNVSVDVRKVVDTQGRLWLQLNFTSPNRPRAFSAAYSPDSARRLVELMDAALRGFDSEERETGVADGRGRALTLVPMTNSGGGSGAG